jgi:hypothetical protein
MSTAPTADTIKDLMTRPEAPLSVPLSRRGSGADPAPGAELRHIRAYLARQEEIAATNARPPCSWPSRG